mgnify:FL=1
MLGKLFTQNFEKISDLEKLIPKDEIYKFGRTYHFNAIALNKKGLKNLFKIISLANTTYLYKTPRILEVNLMNLEKGLLLAVAATKVKFLLRGEVKREKNLLILLISMIMLKYSLRKYMTI